MSKKIEVAIVIKKGMVHNIFATTGSVDVKILDLDCMNDLKNLHWEPTEEVTIVNDISSVLQKYAEHET